eukprot:TRINITY_DN6772_c0_g2_i2.p1 TRINITY_DN6772_c0_g2~~TRINITY_DN6772_c0_g2_i2.p1  ORF type:complete len:317 (+),score=41.97 TRINITY_DN6772_c0_g2_i2:70-1020(+)
MVHLRCVFAFLAVVVCVATATLSAIIFIPGGSFCLGLLQYFRAPCRRSGPVRAGQALTIVSAQFGANDRIQKLPDLPDGTRGVFYTESTAVNAGTGWVVVHRPYHSERCDDAASSAWCNLDISGKYSMSQCTDPAIRAVMAAKFYKLNAYLLPETASADMIFWSDSDELSTHTCLPCDLNERAAKLLQDADFAVAKHSVRNNVTSEVKPAAQRAAHRARQPREVMEKDMLEGIAYMKAQGFLDDAGLNGCAQLLFWRTRPNVQKAMDDWWKFNQWYTFRDQISGPWVFKKNNVQVKNVCVSWSDACVMKSILSTRL